MGLTRRSIAGALLVLVACTWPITPYGFALMAIGLLLGFLMSPPV